MSKIPKLPSVLACATLAFAGAGLANAAHAQSSPAPGQSASPQAAPSQNENRRTWTSEYSGTNDRFLRTAMGSPMGAKGGKMQKCSQKAFGKGLWGKARKRFIRKCMDGRSAIDSRSMGAAMGTPMGEKPDSKMQKCSQKALAKGLWGKARKRFMKKCLE